MDYKYFVKSKEYKNIPDGVVIILVPDVKKFVWFYYRVENKQFYGDFIDFSSLDTKGDFEKEAMVLILEQVTETIHKLNEKVN